MKRYLYFILPLAIIACTKTPEEQTEAPKDCNIHGVAQKGQFVKGAHVTAFAMDSDLVATGESFPASISDDLGSFEVSGKTSSPYFELRAEGYYFNEMEGSVSSSPLYLEAFVKSDDTAANINLMTTAIRPRVKRLIKEGETYANAVVQAQNELLRSLGFMGSAGDFLDMDITGTSEGDGMLLAFACMIQGNRSASEVTSLIQEVASDMEADGELGSAVLEKVMSQVSSVNPFRVIENLAKYYSEKGLAVTTVPAFYKYIDPGYDAPFKIVDGADDGSNHEAVGVNSVLLADHDRIDGEIDVLATIDFTVEADSQGVTIEKTNVLGPAFQISFQIPANTDVNGRTIRLVFKDASGHVLDYRDYVQGGSIRAIDLGLKVYWAESNIGATSPEEFGEFYAWGEIETKETYDWPSYSFAQVTPVWMNDELLGNDVSLLKYTSEDNKSMLDSGDDVAQVKLGGEWRMPTEEDWVELQENCTWTWTTKNNVKGHTITSNLNGNSIFLPATGFKEGTEHYSSNGYCGIYWSSTLVTGVGAPYDYYYARTIIIDSNRFQGMMHNRCSGFTVRPVATAN